MNANNNELSPPRAVERPAGSGEEILRRLHEEHDRIAAAVAEVARLTRPGQLEGAGGQHLEGALHALRVLLPAHTMNEFTILAPELEGAVRGAAPAMAESRRLHADLDVEYTDLQAKIFSLLLGIADPRVQRAARRAALAFQRHWAHLTALGRSAAFEDVVLQLPGPAAARVLEGFAASDARRRMKEAASP